MVKVSAFFALERVDLSLCAGWQLYVITSFMEKLNCNYTRTVNSHAVGL